MKRNALILLPMAAALWMTTGAQAQGPGGFGGPGGGGGFQPPPAMMAKIQEWRQWRDHHKNVTSLQRTLGALADMEQDPQTKLTKPQAKIVLSVLNKWQVKPALTDAQALQVNKQLTAPLTLIQIKKIATASQGRGGGFGGGRPSGPGGGPGGRPAFDPASFPSPRDYNPLNPDTQPMARARDRARQRLAQLKGALTASAR